VIVVIVINEDTQSLASCKQIGGGKSLLLSFLAEDPIPILVSLFLQVFLTFLSLI
jgi:hypothetical protein